MKKSEGKIPKSVSQVSRRSELANNYMPTSNTDDTPKFVIPRKKQETNLFTEIALDSREFQVDILPLLKRHYSHHANRDASFNYTKCKLVTNESLLNKFEEKRREMKLAKVDASITYGFWQVFLLDEVNSICNNGLSNNYHLGTLGRPDLGVYVGQYSDVLTSAPLMDGVSGTLIIFKILKGRTKLVPCFTSGHLEPAPKNECHAAKQDQAATVDLSPYATFESSLLYVYDYQDVDLENPPRNVCPIAVIHYAFNENKGLHQWLKSEALLWSGGLRFDDGKEKDFASNVHMVSYLAKMKPPYLGEQLLIKKLLPAATSFQWAPINELRSDSTQGVLYKQKRDLRLNTGHFVSIFRLTQERMSEKYADLITTMYKNICVGVASLRDGTAILVFPPSHFASQLGIPLFTDASSGLYCLVLSFRSLVTGGEYIRDSYDNMVRYDVGPSEAFLMIPSKLLNVGKKSTEQSPQEVSAKSSPSTNVNAMESPNIDASTRDPRIQKRLQRAEIAGPSTVNKPPPKEECTILELMGSDEEDVVVESIDDSEVEPIIATSAPRIVPLEEAETSEAASHIDNKSSTPDIVEIDPTTNTPVNISGMDNGVLNVIYQPRWDTASTSNARRDFVGQQHAAPSGAVRCNVVVPDIGCLTHAKPEQMRKLLETFSQWKKTGKGDWRVKLHSLVVTTMGCRINDSTLGPAPRQCSAEIIELLDHYRVIEGIVDLLDGHACDKDTCSSTDYLACLQTIKSKAGNGRCILLTDMDQNSEMAQQLPGFGIEMMNIPKLLTDVLNNHD